MNLEFLDWDSSFFDINIGRIICEKDIDALETRLLEAKRKAYSLLYVFMPETKFVTPAILNRYFGKLVDRKVNFRLDISKLNKLHSSDIRNYTGNSLTKELLDLSYLSGSYSRFLLDEKLPKSAFERLYKTWIEKSVSGELADRVFVWYHNNRIAGFVTLKIKDNEGEIGLIAVAEEAQGKQIGTKLLDACVHYLQQNKIPILNVPTQLHNQQACNFYKKYGFYQKNITNIYHFWL